MQSNDADLNSAIKLLESSTEYSYITEHRLNGFANVLIQPRELADLLKIELAFRNI
jgi:hypothetical protein